MTNRPGWQPLPSNSPAPRPVADGLDRVLASLGAGSLSTFQTIFGQWDELAGPRFAPVTRPVRLRGSVLVVSVDDPMWQAELRWHTQALVEAVNRAIDPARITRIDVVARPSDR